MTCELELEDSTLANEQSRWDVRKFSFSQRTVNEWNTISTDRVRGSIMAICSRTKYTVISIKL